MPCTRLRKSLQVGQAQRRKSKHQTREEKKKSTRGKCLEKSAWPKKKEKIPQPDYWDRAHGGQLQTKG